MNKRGAEKRSRGTAKKEVRTQEASLALRPCTGKHSLTCSLSRGSSIASNFDLHEVPEISQSKTQDYK
jgi:hypothetical protein